jgi:hypothetical protein
MLLYSWAKVFRRAEADPNRINGIMKMLINKQLPKNTYDPIFRYAQMDFSGESFLLHPDVLLYNAYKYTPRDIAVYYAMSSVRLIGDYLATKKLTLDLLHSPVSLDLIKDNKLLRIEDDNIHFIYEEVTKRNIH